MSDSDLESIHVSPPEPLDGPVHLAPYDPLWSDWFNTIERAARDALGERALVLEHVGSTSVPGLAAKPIIDVLLVVRDAAAEDDYRDELVRAGFSLKIREPDWYDHRLFKFEHAPCNLHVFSQGCAEIERMLAFRDRLRADSADRKRYEDAKRTLAEREWKYMQNYADAKSEVVEEILERAFTE